MCKPYAGRVRTPTLHVCGTHDKIIPAGQALKFHNTLQSVTAVGMLTYPREGHGIRSTLAIFDFPARVMAWFEKHIPGHSIPPAGPDNL